MHLELAKTNMIEQQIRPWNVLEIQTLNALEKLHRERFVPTDQTPLAYVDTQVPLLHNETMLEPKLAARMVECLDVSNDQTILQIGTGSGYVTALLALMGHHVTALEINTNIHDFAKENLLRAGLHNIQLLNQDCFDYIKLAEPAQFDRIIITGSLLKVDEKFLELLAPQGKLIAIEGQEPIMEVVLYDKSGLRKSYFETSVAPLTGNFIPTEFVF